MANWAQFGHLHLGVYSFVVSGLDINGCVLSYFEGTANLHCYTSCTLTTLHCSTVSFLQCCHMKIYKIFIFEGVLTSVRYCISSAGSESISDYKLHDTNCS